MMDCDTQEYGASQAFWSQFGRKAYEKRIPAFGGIDLTARCNLQCVHCFINTSSMRAAPPEELSTERIHRLIDEITEAGCLFFLLTGGEPLLHPDFCDIYRHVKENGIGVMINTNGTLLADKHITLFQELPPIAVEISLYGATQETYELVTCVQGSYEKCIEGIHRLMDGHVQLRLKTIVMTLNRHEFSDMKRMACEWGCEFRSSSAIFPALDGDHGPLQWRIPPKEAVALEAGDPAVLRRWRNNGEKAHKEYCLPDALYECKAGASAFHVNSEGRLMACSFIHSPEYCFDLKNGSFIDGWNGPLSGVLNCKKAANIPCVSCIYRPYCGYCIPKLMTEHKYERNEISKSYQCMMAVEVYNAAKGTEA